MIHYGCSGFTSTTETTVIWPDSVDYPDTCLARKRAFEIQLPITLAVNTDANPGVHGHLHMRNCVDERITGWPRISDFLHLAKITFVLPTLVLGVLGSIPLIILTPPFQVPDEVQHFYRAFQLSEFHLRAEVWNGVAGGTLPDSLPVLVEQSVDMAAGAPYPATPEPLRKTLALRTIPLNPAITHFVAFPRSAFYSPLPYLPAALGIAAGRALDLGPLYLLYLGRLFNCMTALALLGLAVYAMPVGREFIALAGLLPMALYLYASLSADAVLIGCALLFSALAFRAGRRGEWKVWELGAAAVAGAVFCSVKPVYAPMLLAAAMPGALEPEKAGRVIREHAILVAVAMGVTMGWLLFAKSTMTGSLSGAHTEAEIGFVLHHPTILLRAIAKELRLQQILVRIFQAEGIFGWMTLPQWLGFYLLPLINFAVLWKMGVAGRMRRSAVQAAWYLALAAASWFLVIVAAYMMWAHLGQADVLGVQGRYLIPILGLVVLAAIELAPAKPDSAPPWKGMVITAAIVIAQIGATDATIVRGFHVF